jgi:hypothetical protein
VNDGVVNRAADFVTFGLGAISVPS